MRGRSIERCILEVAGRISIAEFADRLEQRVVAGAILESERFLEASGWAVGGSRRAAIRIWNRPPSLKQVRFILGRQDSVPVDGTTKPLRIGVCIEAIVERCGEKPDLAAGALGGRKLRIALRVICTERTLRESCTWDRAWKSKHRTHDQQLQEQTRAHGHVLLSRKSVHQEKLSKRLVSYCNENVITLSPCCQVHTSAMVFLILRVLCPLRARRSSRMTGAYVCTFAASKACVVSSSKIILAEDRSRKA